jgi:hypothetical protein
MKYIILIFTLLPFWSYGQKTQDELLPLEIPDFEIESNEILFREIIEFEGDQKKLHATGLKAISDLYRSSKSVIDLNDLENGTLIVKGNLPLSIDGYYFILGGIKPIQITYLMEHTLAIESKDNRIRITLDSFRFLSGTSSDGETLTFNPPNNLDKSYLESFIELKNSEKLKKRELANAYNMSLVLNELDKIASEIFFQINKSYEKDLNDDW